MRIAHLCLSNWFVDDMGYQENELVRAHVAGKHEVLVLASTEVVTPANGVRYVSAGEYVSREGARVVRLPYRKLGVPFLERKVRAHPGVYRRLSQFNPDVILFHGTCGWELLNVARYVRRHPECVLFVDSHEDWNNSARTLLSRVLLHKFFYGPILRSTLPEIRAVLCVSTESMEFCRSLYGIDASLLEFFPLGGWPVDDAEYESRRSRLRSELDVEGCTVFLQSGKQTVRKKLLDTLRAFCRVGDHRNRLVIAGTLAPEIECDARQLIQSDSRIVHVGWVGPDRLTDLLCAADVYVQPGTQSATMQHSLCCRCAIAIDDVAAHRPYNCDNGWLLGESVSLEDVFRLAADANLDEMKRRSFEFASQRLDYRMLSERVLR